MNATRVVFLSIAVVCILSLWTSCANEPDEQISFVGQKTGLDADSIDITGLGLGEYPATVPFGRHGVLVSYVRPSESPYVPEGERDVVRFRLVPWQATESEAIVHEEYDVSGGALDDASIGVAREFATCNNDPGLSPRNGRCRVAPVMSNRLDVPRLHHRIADGQGLTHCRRLQQ